MVNGLVKPIVKLISLPLTFMTLGLFGLVINAALLLLIAWLSDLIGITFTIGDFPPDFSINTLTTALIGGIAISLVGTLVGMAVRGLSEPDRLPEIADALRHGGAPVRDAGLRHRPGRAGRGRRRGP